MQKWSQGQVKVHVKDRKSWSKQVAASPDYIVIRETHLNDANFKNPNK